VPTKSRTGIEIVLSLQQEHFITDRRAEQLGLAPLFGETENPFPWMSEAMDLKKEKNFFETRVTEYRTGGGLDWD
jgi:ribonucleoside-diphosphate reductase beta chain